MKIINKYPLLLIFFILTMSIVETNIFISIMELVKPDAGFLIFNHNLAIFELALLTLMLSIVFTWQTILKIESKIKQ